MKEQVSVEATSVGKYIPELDGFRAIPMFFVLWGHFGAQYSHFWFPVQGFFILSGFLISRILIKEKAKGFSFKAYFKTYWSRRVLRIFPIYYLYLFVLVGLYFVLPDLQDLPKLLVGLFTYTFNFLSVQADIDFMHSKAFEVTQHLWTMSVEEQFYIFLPLIIWFASERWLRIWTIVFIVGAVVFRTALGAYYIETLQFAANTGTHVRVNTFSHFDAFFLGVAINVFSLKRYKVNWWSWSILFFMLFIGAGIWNVYDHLGQWNGPQYWSHLGYHITWYQNYEYVWSYTLINLTFLFCVLALITQGERKPSLWGSFLKFRPLVLFGRLSYGIYTYHLIILYFFSSYIYAARRPEMWINLCYFVLYLLLVFVISWASYEFFEKKFLGLKPEYKK